MQDAVTFANALADTTRFRVVCLLQQETLCVCELADILKLPQSTLSSHLRVIERADMLDCERRGKWLFYSVKPSIRPLLKAVFKHFAISPETSTALARDQGKATRCVQQRSEDCCPPAPRKTSRKQPR